MQLGGDASSQQLSLKRHVQTIEVICHQNPCPEFAMCVSLANVTWNSEAFKNQVQRLRCVDMGKIKWRAVAITWINQAQNNQPLREKVPLARIIQSDCSCSLIYQSNEFYPILYFVTLDISLVYEFEWLFWYFISLEIIIGIEWARTTLKDGYWSYDNSPREFKLPYSTVIR